MVEQGCRIACVTMVRDEPVFLPRWVDHWRKTVPPEHMFILVDGFDQVIPPEAAGCQVVFLPRRPPAPGWDEARWRMLTAFAHALLERFDVVVLNDVDELVVLDPAAGGSLASALAEARELGVITPFAIEVVHRVDLEEEPLVAGEPVLGRRRYGRIHASYCKPCIVARPVRWSMGGHYSDHPVLHLSEKLFLFHLRAMDAAMLHRRQAARLSLVSDGEGRVREGIAGGGWARDADNVDQFLQSFCRSAPEVTDFTFGWQRQRIRRSWRQEEGTGMWVHDRLHNRRSYAIPERFFGVI